MIKFLTGLNQMLWGSGLVGLLLGMGIFCLCSPETGCFRSFRLLFRKPDCTGHGMSVFQACMTSLGAAMGTGNIIGVATALTLGGAGAVFWMWISALCGMGLIYTENVLSCHYRTEQISGAPAYLRYGLKSKKLAGIFAVCCIGASFGMGNMTQSHAMAGILQASFQIPEWLTGICIMMILFLIVSGGAERIGRFSAVIVPFLTGIYLLCAVIILFLYRKNLPAVFSEIFRNAFGIRAIGGGISGTALKYAVSVGIRRGIFSNEAGLGSSGLLHGGTSGQNPEFLGLCGMLEVIADTFLCCTATALVILCTDTLQSGQEGAGLVLTAFRMGMGVLADWVLPPVTALFAFCTLTGWCFCGMNALKSLTVPKYYLKYYQLLFCMAAFTGTVMKLELVWTLADIANACMAYCNLPAMMLLLPEIKNRRTA
ncbi:MAG: amino acid carrier protein [Oscillospiraceae bacterium]|nr:amino acid carrier protein [Oscillospiraceae bacterium]